MTTKTTKEEKEKEVTRTFKATGKVQAVMFRQTMIRGAQRRGLRAGATNEEADQNVVTITLQGDPTKVEEVVEVLRSGKELNSWGARVSKLEEMTRKTKRIEEHQVTTENVDSFQWRAGVEMFL